MKTIISENLFQNCRSLTSAIDYIMLRNGKSVNIAISGGESCIELFKYWSNDNLSVRPNWKKINIFWVDERMVSPDNPRSNYYWFEKILINKFKEINFFRIEGENDIKEEERRYCDVIVSHVPFTDQLPRFDIIILGVGSDGHTASIFEKSDYESDRIVIDTIMKEKEEPRISLTLKVINNAENIMIFCFGEAKKNIISKIISGQALKDGLPIGRVNLNKENVSLYTDKESVDL